MKGGIDMIILHLFVYILIGFVSTFVAALIHVIKAMKMGYNVIEYWNDHPVSSGCWPHIVVGLLIWPIRLIQFIMSIDDLYIAYEEYEENGI